MKVTELYTYPVKSLTGIPLDCAELSRTGIRFDRNWMLVQPDGTFMTQRIYPQMALINTAIENDNLVLSPRKRGSAETSAGTGCRAV